MLVVPINLSVCIITLFCYHDIFLNCILYYFIALKVCTMTITHGKTVLLVVNTLPTINRCTTTHFQTVCFVVGTLPHGDLSTVCQSEAVLSQQLARIPHTLSIPTQGQGPKNGPRGSRIALQTPMVGFPYDF